MSLSIADQLHDLRELDSDQYRLTDWEIEFVDSVDKQTREDRPITPRQATIISGLWDKVFILGKRGAR